MRAEAEALLVAVDAMTDYYAKNEPTRRSRPGIVALASRADSLRAALDASLSAPGAPSPGKSRFGAHATSNAAALAAIPKSGTVRMNVLNAFVNVRPNGLTHEELSGLLIVAGHPASPSGIRTRCSELVEGGWILDSGVTRPTSLGNDAIVWVLSNTGQARLGLA